VISRNTIEAGYQRRMKRKVIKDGNQAIVFQERCKSNGGTKNDTKEGHQGRISRKDIKERYRNRISKRGGKQGYQGWKPGKGFKKGGKKSREGKGGGGR